MDDRVDALRQRLECRRRQAEQRTGQIAQHRHKPRIVAFAPQPVAFEIAADAADAVFGAVGADQAHHFGRAEVDEIAQHVRAEKTGGAGQQHGCRRGARRDRGRNARAVDRFRQRDLGFDVEDLDRFAGEHAVDGRGQAGDGRRGEHRRQRQFDAQRLVQFEHQRQRRQRVAAAGEEVVVGAQRFAPQHIAPDRQHRVFGRRLRVADRALRDGVLAGRRQRAAVDLAVGGQRHRIEEHERRRQHRFRQTPRQTRAQRSGIDAIGDHRIRHQPAVAGAVLAQQHGYRLHAGQGRERIVDFAQFDAEAAQLDLMIATADELQGVVGIPAREIAGAVHPRVGFVRERIEQEAFRREFRGIEITAGDTGATDEEFADHAARHRLQMPVEQMDPHARQRPAGRQIVAGDFGRIHGRQQGRADRGFGGAVVVAQHDTAAGDTGETSHLFDRHAFAADHHQIQCRQQRFALRARRPALAPAAPERGRRVDRGDAMVVAETLQLERAQFGRRRMQHQRRTAGQRRKHVAHGRVENQRRDHQQALVIETMPRQEALHQIHRAAMLHHHALGRTGGTGGVDQIGRIARTDVDVRRSLRIHDRSGMQHRHSGRQRRSAFAQQRRHQQRRGAGILQQELQTFVRAGRIQRQIGRTGEQYTKHRNHRIRGTVAEHGDVCARPDVLRMQGLRDAVGAARHLRIGPFAAGLDQRGGLRRARGLKREQPLQRVGLRRQGRSAVAQCSEGGPFFVVQQLYPRQRQIRIRGGAVQQGHEVPRHPRDRRRREQLRAVVDQPGQTFGTVGQRKRDFETRGIGIGLDVLGA